MHASVSTTKLNKKRLNCKEKSSNAVGNKVAPSKTPLKRSYSGSDLLGNIHVRREFHSCGKVQSKLERLRQSCNSTLDPTVTLSEETCECYSNVRPSSACEESRQMSLDGNHQAQANRIVRHRSGSWTGVNESDEDLECMANQNHSSPFQVDNSPAFDNSMASSSYNCGEDGMRYQNSYGSFNSESTVPHGHHYGSDEEKLRRRLKFFFMNPIEKWQAKKRFPWKLLIQIIKIFICTVQLCVFASQRYSHVTYLWDTKISFSHLFIKDWDASREVTAYPPAVGLLALYKIEDFYDFLDYAVDTFSTIEETAIGAYSYSMNEGIIVMPEFCISEYAPLSSRKHPSTVNFVTEKCVTIPTSVLNKSFDWSTKEFLASKNISIDFGFLIDATFSFILKTTKLLSTSPVELPECYSLETSIYFDNSDHDGQMLVELDIGAEVLDCEAPVDTKVEGTSCSNSLQRALNVLTIIICVFSLFMCLRAIFRAQKLKYALNVFFKHRYQRDLSVWETFEFINLWYVLICINDFLIIIGSIIKMSLESQDYEGYLDKWNVCSLLLGTGNLFIWFGCLRYFGFFETYNVLILTIKSCFPNVLRYSSCFLMVFSGYSLCGWLVLGPYHLKFRSLSTTAECLYSLINGDDMFATFSSTMGKDAIVWWFSRIYLYTFCSLFIYVILSLFIAIITDAYETIKRYYDEGFPMSDLRNFANECQADPWSGVFHDGERTIQDIVHHICCCCPSVRTRRGSSSAYERIPS